ncbi:MAG TPA: BREX-1 system adenine-specific DNA-methyltransferase PglX [Candidatus Ozemobacteraceae bacterium]|nr:BREX-1 system adenine-specific DNA-methyltransferase PglX [Candidatus Ozemobacteraceae bacterium]
MDKNKIKAYAPQARKELIAAVTAKAQVLGLSAERIEPVEVKGDLALIAGRPFPRPVAGQRRNLEASINREGFGAVMERIAFTWFNRFSALRYMEVHGFLDHGYRVLSHPKGGAVPEILEHATDVELIGLDKEKVTELRLAGHKDAELYRMLLIAQCNTLHPALPFLFEKTNDETELLLPDNLLHTDSPIRKLVSEIDEGDWAEVEIIGWLYQFYISEKKDAVIGKVVKSEDIPAATQLFTPNWIVKYLVQNTLGRQWLATYPQSGLRARMEFYIEPAEQTDEVKAKLREITPSELNPETITFFDPACGSGHILVEAYNLFKEIYLERGYRTRDIPRLILEKNLYGLDIDERAAQLASFALMMKARADERGIFKSEPPIRPNVLAIQESNGLDADEIASVLTREKVEKLVDTGKPDQENIAGISDGKPVQPVLTVSLKPDVEKAAIASLLALFKDAKTFGSLLRVPENLVKILPSLEKLVDPSIGRDLAGHTAAEALRPFVRQARLLNDTYDNVVANPPYMGNKGMNVALKDFAKKNYADTKSDLFAMFIERGFGYSKQRTGYNGMVTMQSWMFLSSFEEARSKFLGESSLFNMAHLGARAFSEISGEVVQTTAFVFTNIYIQNFNSRFFRLIDLDEPEKQQALKDKSHGFTAHPDDFKKIPGSPIAYWVKGISIFEREKFADSWFSGGRIKTHDGSRFIRYHWEVGRESNRWKRLIKGGEFRRHFGNEDFLVDWSPESVSFYENHGGLYPLKFMEKEGICWSKITSSCQSFRIKRAQTEYDSASPTIYNESFCCDYVALSFLNSPVAQYFLFAINPTMNTQIADVMALPLFTGSLPTSEIGSREKEAVCLSKGDWDAFETSWDFQGNPLQDTSLGETLDARFYNWVDGNNLLVQKMRGLETENNRLFIEAYGLQNAMTPEVPEEQITLTVNPKYRYGTGLTQDEYQHRFRYDSTKELLSYSVGCMMGRYSLDRPGLIYANAGNEGFDHSQYKTFPADDDGIIPISDIDWFTDDATLRLVEFIRVVFGPEHLDENLAWIAESFDHKKGEASIDTIRRYFSTQFFKSHMQMYKKRPIYWLFSSGKQKAFEALVYLHRYNESTLSRMRAQYVTPLQGKINARIEHLRREIDGAGSASMKTKLRKEIETLTKKQTELAKFDEELRHYADKRIKLDLDDGVRVNYGKFGNLLAEVKNITGGDEE